MRLLLVYRSLDDGSSLFNFSTDYPCICDDDACSNFISMLTFTAYHLLTSLVIKGKYCPKLSDASLGVLLPACYDSTL